MRNVQRFPFVEESDTFGIPDFLPKLPITLSYYNSSVTVSGLLDTGASVNVLPYNIGIQLGGIWEKQTTSVMLGGNLAPVEARGLILSAEIGSFPPVRLVFAWCLSDDVPLLLGRLIRYN
jgi:hypothetical protein